MKARLSTPLVVLVALVAVAAVAAGCGSSNDNTSSDTGASSPAPSTTTSTPSTTGGGGGETLKLAADPSGQLKFDKSTLDAKAGKVTITMSNPASLPHGVSVEGNGVDKSGQVVQQGGTSTVTASLKPGTYTFYCPVPGHKQAGMKGTLTVK